MGSLKRGQVPIKQLVTLHTAKDVCYLYLCPRCKRWGDRRRMARVSSSYFHGRCVVAIGGLDALLALPRDEKFKLSIGDIGYKAMTALVRSYFEKLPPGTYVATMSAVKVRKGRMEITATIQGRKPKIRLGMRIRKP